MCVYCCVSLQGLHPSEDAFEGRLRHNAAQRLSQFEGSSKCTPQMRPSFISFWRMHCYYPSRPPISQDSLRPRKERKKERKKEKLFGLCSVARIHSQTHLGCIIYYCGFPMNEQVGILRPLNVCWTVWLFFKSEPSCRREISDQVKMKGFLHNTLSVC